MASAPQETCLEMNEICSINITMQRPSPAKKPQNLGKTLSLSSQAILVSFFSPPSSTPTLPTVFFQAAMLIGFIASLVGVFLQNASPRIALSFEKFGLFSTGIGICIIASLLVHPNLTWMCWLGGFFILVAFVASFK